MSFFRDIFGGGGSEAAKQAYGAYSDQIQKAIAEYEAAQKQGRTDVMGMYGKAMGYEQPYLQAGGQGMQAYLGTLGLPGGEGRQSAINRFQTSPGYKFAMQQGTQALQRQGAASGLTGSGAEARALTQYGQGLANQQYGQYQGRLAGLAQMGAGMGQTMGQQSLGTGQFLANLGRGYAQDIGGAYGSLGAGAASSIMAGYGADARQRAAMWNAFGKLGGAAIGAAGQLPWNKWFPSGGQ